MEVDGARARTRRPLSAEDAEDAMGADGEAQNEVEGRGEEDEEGEEEVVIDPEDVERHLRTADAEQLAAEVLTRSFPPVSASELVVKRARALRTRGGATLCQAPPGVHTVGGVWRSGRACGPGGAGEHQRLALGGGPAPPVHAAQGAVAQDLYSDRGEHEAADPHEPQVAARRNPRTRSCASWTT